MAEKIKIIERFSVTVGRNLFCHCESELCASSNAHPAFRCHKHAAVLAECFGLKQQLCQDCLAFAQKRYNVTAVTR